MERKERSKRKKKERKKDKSRKEGRKDGRKEGRKDKSRKEGTEQTGQTEREKRQTEGETGQTDRETGQADRETGQGEREKGQTDRETGQTERETGQTDRETGQGDRTDGQEVTPDTEYRIAMNSDVCFLLLKLAMRLFALRRFSTAVGPTGVLGCCERYSPDNNSRARERKTGQHSAVKLNQPRQNTARETLVKK